MLYFSWDRACHGYNGYFSFWAICCPFTPLEPQKMKISKKWNKKPGNIIILQKCTKNHDHMLYCSLDMACDTCNFYFSFWAIFCPFTPITAQKIKILQNWKKTLEISSFYTCVPKIMSRWSTVPEVWCVTDGRTDGWTDAQKKWHIEVGAPHKNLNSKKASDIFGISKFSEMFRWKIY